MSKLIVFILLVPIFLLAHHDTKHDINGTILLRTGDYIEHNRLIIGKSITLLTNSIDDFFIDDVTDEELHNRSYGRIEFSTIQKERETLTYETNFKLSLDLPETKRRVKLVLNNDEDEHTTKDPINTLNDDDFSSSLGYIFQNDRYLSFQSNLGAKFSSNSEVFFRTRARINIYIEKFKLTIAQKLTFFSKSDDIYSTQLDLSRAINDNFSLKLANKADINPKDNSLDLTSSINLYHILNKKEGILYSLGTNGDNKNNLYGRDYTYNIRYRNRFKDGYYYDINPAIEYLKEKREYIPSLTLKVGIEFFAQ